MIFTLIGMVVLGVGIAGMASLLFRVLGRRAPGGLLALVAGLGMFGFVLWNDYTWFARTRDVLPGHVQVARTFSEPSPLQPWSYLLAPVHRFSAVNTATTQRNEALPGLVLAEIYLVARYQPSISHWQLYDCQTPRRADVSNVEDLNPAAQATIDWHPLAAGDALREIVCRNAAPPS